jgi:hypothetical protein
MLGALAVPTGIFWVSVLLVVALEVLFVVVLVCPSLLFVVVLVYPPLIEVLLPEVLV